MAAQTASFANTVGIEGLFTFHVGPVPQYFYSTVKPNEISDPSWSPDGTTILFAEHARAVYSVRALSVGATQNITNVYRNLHPISDPTYSNDMYFILFSEQVVLPDGTYPYGQTRLRYMNADGSNVQTILDDGNANLHPCWVTPTQVAFQWWQYGATPSSEFNISLIDLAGRGRIDLGPGEYPRTVIT